jgi:hypothetical protein
MDISSKVSYRIVNSIVCLLVFSVPAGALAMILILFFVPKNFPYQGQPAYENRRLSAVLTKTQFKSVDFIGAGLLLTATLFLVSALQEAGVDYAWKSAFVITFLAIAGIAWILFFLWERWVTLFSKTIEPVFPWRFIRSRVWLGMIAYINSLLLFNY